MSRYLISRIEASPRITLLTRTSIETIEGDAHLSRVRWRNSQMAASESRDIAHVFVMTGAGPNTEWLEGGLELDAKGFIKTGAELPNHPRAGS
jgi:thioredoxin reductase (NADPH)